MSLFAIARATPATAAFEGQRRPRGGSTTPTAASVAQRVRRRPRDLGDDLGARRAATASRGLKLFGQGDAVALGVVDSGARLLQHVSSRSGTSTARSSRGAR